MEDDKKNKEDILKFALDELKKTVDSLKQGKLPTLSAELKKISQMLNAANQKSEEKKISEEDINNVLREVAKKVSKR